MPNTTDSPPATTVVHLSQRDMDSLVRVADIYMSIRPIRSLIRFTAPLAMRARIRYVADESKFLKRLARDTRASMRASREDERDVPLTIPALVGFWGRLLASLRTPRLRRRLSRSEYEVRDALHPRFQIALADLLPRCRRQIEDQLATRRPVEEIWMREALGLPQRISLDAPAGRTDTSS